MTNKKIVFTTVLAALMMCPGTPARADDDPQLSMQWNLTDESTEAYAFTDWTKLSFDTAGNAVLDLTSGETKTYAPGNWRSITFPTQTPGGTFIPEVKTARLIVYPNPVQNELTVEGEGPLGIISVIDLSGRKVKTLESGEKKTILNLSTLPKGIYILQAGGRTSKIVKK